MEKVQFGRTVRIPLIITAILLAGIMASLLYFKALRPNFQEMKSALYSYSIQLTNDYEVTLKQNSLYDKPQGENATYLTSLVDKIMVTFNYAFQGERKADIKGNYDIVAVVEGFTSENNQANTIWQKQFQLVQPTTFTTEDQKIAFTKDVSINLKEFNDFVNKVANESSVHSESKLTVYMNVNLNASTDKGPVVEKTTSSISLPLNSNYFKIAKTIANNKPGAIVQTEKARVPIAKKMVVLFSIILGISLIALMVLTIFTSNAPKDLQRELIRKIFNRHGSRLVSLNEALTGDHQFENKVRTFEDLVRVSDEVAKPIFYQYNEDLHKIDSFYVVDDNCLYQFKVSETVSGVGVALTLEVGASEPEYAENNKSWGSVARSRTSEELKTKEG